MSDTKFIDETNTEIKKELWDYLKVLPIKYNSIMKQYIITNTKEKKIINCIWEGHDSKIDLSEISTFVAGIGENGSKDFVKLMGYDNKMNPKLYISRLDCSQLELNKYILEVNIQENIIDQFVNLPQTPFVIEVIKDCDKYLVSRFELKNKYIVTKISKGSLFGSSYDYNYTKEDILKLINNGSWKFIKSQINLE